MKKYISMDINEIIPYERNARNNKKAIPIVADSIKEFGLRGQIVLESRENPVIVTGHTRVAACKALGWKEIPDENIAYCDGLSEEQIKAYRIADNKTGEVSQWNIGLLKSEMKSISRIDMTKFGIDFKSKYREHGAERLRTDKSYNLDLVNRFDCNERGFPELKGIMSRPKEIIAFHYAKTTPQEERKNKAICFFEDDYQFERVWNSPQQYLGLLKQFSHVLTPDFSLYMDMPEPMQAWNRYRSQALGKYWQSKGIKVIPTLSWAQPESYKFCFEGVPRRSTVATSTVGIKQDEYAMKVFKEGLEEALKRLRPKRLLLYGGNIGIDFKDIEVIEYQNTTTAKFKREKIKATN